MKLLIFFLLPLSLFAQLNIAVTYPYIGELTKTIGGDKVNSVVLARGNWDPHFIIPKPSLISKVRQADGMIINGGQLEIGWLPPLINRAANPKVAVNAETFLNLSSHLHLLHKPHSVSRAGGDVHPDGNPHFSLDPKNILVLATAIRNYLSKIDAANAKIYDVNYENFVGDWKKKMLVWQAKMETKKGMKVIQYHDALAYFLKAYGIQNVGTIEPLPGIPASSKHTIELIRLIKEEKVSFILHDVYHTQKTAKYISSQTGIQVVVMPQDIGALESIDSLTSLFDYLCDAI